MITDKVLRCTKSQSLTDTYHISMINHGDALILGFSLSSTFAMHNVGYPALKKQTGEQILSISFV